MFGLQSRSAHIWVMHSMIMDETQHVFPGEGVCEWLCVCQEEAVAMCAIRTAALCIACSWRSAAAFIKVFYMLG